LLQAEELKVLLDQGDPNLRIIDFRHQAKYYLGHIPGAIQIWRRETPDQKKPWPGLPVPRAQMEKLLGRLGIAARHTIVIYSDQCDHTHLWWVLAHYGFPLERLKLLDGGLEAWKRKGYPTQLTSTRVQPAFFKFPAEPGASAGHLNDVKAALSALEGDLDVRPRAVSGEKTRKGLAGPHSRGRLDSVKEARVPEGPDKGCWKSAAEIRKIYAGRDVTPELDVYIYGHTDLCATYTLVSLYLAGYPLEKLHVYAGSWVEWSRSKEPVATGSSGPAK
jgi:thiosulfate/3-mercaptopyruvate sulfurtransferase